LDSTETTAAGPDAGPAPVPRNDPRPPFRERRAFLTEIAIVVIGVLLALGAEQVVQWLNWQSEVKETRKTLANEISYNLASRKLRNDQVECIDRRLDELQRWHDSWVAGKPLKPTSPIGSVASRTVRFDAWNIAQNGQVAAHIPLEDRIRYARLYDFFRSFQASIAIEGEGWGALQKFEGAQSLAPRDLMELQGLIINLRAGNAARKGNWPIFPQVALEFGIPIGPYPANQRICRSIYASKP
jgi:type II secretory pathway pseudopilin PulG